MPKTNSEITTIEHDDKEYKKNSSDIKINNNTSGNYNNDNNNTNKENNSNRNKSAVVTSALP
ncbi:MAG: hypothetical protein ACJ71A_11175, partial [Nitrososphaeraceae archaeon]